YLKNLIFSNRKCIVCEFCENLDLRKDIAHRLFDPASRASKWHGLGQESRRYSGEGVHSPIPNPLKSISKDSCSHNRNHQAGCVTAEIFSMNPTPKKNHGYGKVATSGPSSE
ncbi:unnamed protein product, partial [Allacma fusca]